MTVDPYAYEYEQRQRIAKTDWDQLHRDGDKPSRIIQFVKRNAHRVIGFGVRTERGGWRPEGRA